MKKSSKQDFVSQSRADVEKEIFLLRLKKNVVGDQAIAEKINALRLKIAIENQSKQKVKENSL